ncbi:MAG: acyl-CoA reductase [Bacteroidota bacterium]
MTLSERLQLLVKLGSYLRQEEDEFLEALQKRTAFNNAWFTLENQQTALQTIAADFLSEAKLKTWLQPYYGYFEVLHATREPGIKTIGIVPTDHVPLAVFHDFLCVFIAGYRAQIKPPETDRFVLPYLLKLLTDFDDRAGQYFTVSEKLTGFDAVIVNAEPKNLTSFRTYFGRYPSIVRPPRKGVAVLTGQESEEDLRGLGRDVFQYFGLGDRNIGKIYVPKDYDFTHMLEVFHDWRDLQNHAKYKNNFDYQYSLLLLNQAHFLSNGALILREDPAILSHIAGLYYEQYDNLEELEKNLSHRADDIQLITALPYALRLETTNFGKAHRPTLGDYPGGVDTIAWLLSL